MQNLEIEMQKLRANPSLLLHFGFCLRHYARIPTTPIILPVRPFSAR
jgi:hypothetical protein